MSESRHVFVRNPVNPWRGTISVRYAEKYVSRGLAVWCGKREIRFIEDDHRNVSAARSAAQTKETLRRQSEPGYDRIGRILTEEDGLETIPVVQPWKALGRGSPIINVRSR